MLKIGSYWLYVIKYKFDSFFNSNYIKTLYKKVSNKEPTTQTPLNNWFEYQNSSKSLDYFQNQP
jgi:hypothetical protein